MNPITDHFTTDDGLRIHTVNWVPYGGHKAIVLLVHGINEHSGRYPHVVEYLTGHGYAVYSYDHRGHGLSEGDRAYFPSLEQLAIDLEKYFKIVTSANPNTPIFIYGHSMGSIVSLLFVLKHQAELEGFVCTGLPISVEETMPGPVIAVARAMRTVMPKFPMFFVPSIANSATRDAEIAADALADPLVNKKAVKLGPAVEFAVVGKQVRPEIPKLDLPLLILHGSDDKISPVSGASYLYEHASSEDKTLKIYDGLYHEVHNDPERETVLLDIVTWLDAHSEPADE